MNAKGTIISESIQRSLNTLRNLVPMPGDVTDQGNPGDYAIDGERMAIYVASLSRWRFVRLFEEES